MNRIRPLVLASVGNYQTVELLTPHNVRLESAEMYGVGDSMAFSLGTDPREDSHHTPSTWKLKGKRWEIITPWSFQGVHVIQVTLSKGSDSYIYNVSLDFGA